MFSDTKRPNKYINEKKGRIFPCSNFFLPVKIKMGGVDRKNKGEFWPLGETLTPVSTLTLFIGSWKNEFRESFKEAAGKKTVQRSFLGQGEQGCSYKHFQGGKYDY